MPKRPFRVVLLDKQHRKIARGRLLRLLGAAARALRVRGESVLLLVGDARIRALNARYRKKNVPTDVLSFPGPGGEQGIGDIVISVPTAARNARRFSRSLAEELDLLALHGFLHTLGYDHETDDGEMERLERRLRRRLGVRA